MRGNPHRGRSGRTLVIARPRMPAASMARLAASLPHRRAGLLCRQDLGRRDGKPYSFDTPLSASGAFACPNGEFHVMLGFFNSATVNEWRTPNSIALRFNGHGNVFHVYVEYCTARWRAGGDWPAFPTVRSPKRGNPELKGFPSRGRVYRWSLRYDPLANNELGAVIATIDGETAVCELDGGHKADGATFDRFGLLTVSKSFDSGGEVWIDDVTINGTKDDFLAIPAGTASTTTASIRRRSCGRGLISASAPRASPAAKNSGELGGVIFRGDCRYPDEMACYADRLESLSSDKPLRASGKVCLRRGVSDSGVLIGFFNSRESMQSNPCAG